jgi:4-hydroxybenzoyl-CoA thioesterase
MLTNRRTLRIEWKDCDPAGIVFFPRYFEMFDTSTTALFERALDMPAVRFFEAFGMIGYPLVDARARFIIPSKFSDEVTIETAVTEFRRSSFVMNHRLMKGEELAVEGTEIRVWAVRDPNDPNRIKSQAIPKNIIDKFTAS